MRQPGELLPPRVGVGNLRFLGCGKRFNVICYGNSLTAGNGGGNSYPDALQLMRPGDTIINLGTGNQYTDQMLANFTTDLASISGSLSAGKQNVVIWWESVDSINDHAVTPSQEYTKLKSAAALCHSNGCLIVICGAIPCTDPPADPADLVTLAGLLRADHSVFDGFADLPANPVFNVNDSLVYSNAGGSPNVHLTDYGYTVPVARGFNDALNQIVR